MITIRRSAERGHFDHGWLDTHHTFSFADYHDPRHMGFRSLRVINEDRVAPGQGFPPHPHRDMEIVTYVLDGALAHNDSTGGRYVVRPGDVQRMTAGRGVVHSEYNASTTEPVHLLQIWIVPSARGLAPGYEQKRFSEDERRNRLCVVVSPDGREGSIEIHQDAAIYSAILEQGASVSHALAPGRHVWIQVARGAISVGDTELRAGDGAQVTGEPSVTLTGSGEALLFDLA